MPLPLRRDRGATDPLLIIVGIAISLILLVGGSFAVAAFITSSQDRSARDDLARIATAQIAYHTENDRYAQLAVGPDIAPADTNTELIDGRVGYKNETGANIVVTANKSGWTAVTKSKSGKVFARTSFAGRTVELTGAPGPAPDALGPEKLLRTNLATYPDGYFPKPGNLEEFGLEVTRSALQGSYRNVIDATDGPDGTNLSSYLRWTGGSSAVKTSQYGFNIAGDPTATNVSPGLAAPPVGKTTITVFLRSNVATTAQLRTRLATATAWSGAAVNSAWVTVPANQWTAVTTTVTTTTAAPRVSAALLTGGKSGPNDTLDATGLVVETGVEQLAYFDGGSFDLPTVRTRWKGEPHRSMSEQYSRDIISDREVWRPASKPDGFDLPTGISWNDVREDAMLVKQ